MELIILIIATFGNFILSLLIFRNNPKSLTNILFSSFSICLAFFLVFNYLILHATTSENALLWAKGILITSIAAGPLFYLFVRTFPKSKIDVSKRTLWVLFSWATLNIILALTNNLFSSVTIKNGSVVINPGLAIPSFGILQLSTILLGSWTLFKKYRKSNGIQRLQFRFLTYGISISLGLTLFVTLIMAVVFGNSQFAILSPLFLLIAPASVGYAIIRHRLLDIRLVVARAVAYTLLIAIIGAFFIGSTVTITSLFLDTVTSFEQIVLYALLTLIVALLFQRLKRILEVATDKIFFKADYDSNQLLSELTKIMAETILIDDIANKLLNKIIFEMRITRGAFVLTDGGQILVTETQGYKRDEQPKYSEKDIFSLQAADKNLILEDLDEGSTKDLLKKLNISVVIPLRTGVDHVGLLLLGEKASGEIYSEKDIRVLEIFAPEAAISFENAASVEKIRRFNITLKETVDRQTKDLKEANEQLKSLDKLKDEFLSIASHDLRTPMTAIKSYLWMAVNGRAGELNPQLKHYLDVSYSSSERMITMINDLLNVSRIEAGRVQMSFEDAQLKPIVDQVFAEMAAKASEKSIELKYEEEANLPHIILDKQRFPEVLQNLVGNALKFTPEKGKITVSAKKSKDVGFVEIAVTDTGVGISEEDRKNLFSKYGRMEHSYSAASTTGGTGLGLYITKNYIELHGGTIWVESTLGKGTSFIFNMRIVEKEALTRMNEEASKKQIAPAIPAMK